MEAIFSAGTSQPCRFGTWRTEMDPKGSLPSAPLWRSVSVGPHALERAREADARRVQAHVLDHDVAAARERRRAGAAMNAAGRRVAGNGGASARLEQARPGHAGRAVGRRGGRAELRRRELGVVARGRGLHERGRAVREHARQKHRRSSAGPRPWGASVGDGAQIAGAAHGEGQRLLALGHEARAHLHERGAGSGAWGGGAANSSPVISTRTSHGASTPMSRRAVVPTTVVRPAARARARPTHRAGQAAVGLLLQIHPWRERAHGLDGRAHVSAKSPARPTAATRAFGHGRSAQRCEEVAFLTSTTPATAAQRRREGNDVFASLQKTFDAPLQQAAAERPALTCTNKLDGKLTTPPSVSTRESTALLGNIMRISMDWMLHPYGTAMVVAPRPRRGRSMGMRTSTASQIKGTQAAGSARRASQPRQ